MASPRELGSQRLGAQRDPETREPTDEQRPEHERPSRIPTEVTPCDWRDLRGVRRRSAGVHPESVEHLPVSAGAVLAPARVCSDLDAARPPLRSSLDREGVLLRNVVRDVRVPWALVTGVEARWNVQVFIEGRHFTAWAISSRAERPRVRPPCCPVAARAWRPGRIAGHGRAGGGGDRADEGELRGLSSQPGRSGAPADATVRETWVVPNIALLVVPVLAVVVFTVT